MKIEQGTPPKQFIPITITLETKEEAVAMNSICYLAEQELKDPSRSTACRTLAIIGDSTSNLAILIRKTILEKLKS
jgi:hypothetical protein